jgi:hypothetical protein
MFPMLSIICAFFLSGLTLNPSGHGQHSQGSERPTLRVKALVVEQKYCRGDADAFTVSLRIKLEIANLSKAPTRLLWPMAPSVGKVAASLRDAEAGRFLFAQTASRYPQGQPRFKRLKLERGKKVLKRSEYYLIARYDAATSVPKSVSPGTYAVVLALSPEEEPAAQMKGPDTMTSLTTEPFVVELPADPKVVSCGAEGKSNQ